MKSKPSSAKRSLFKITKNMIQEIEFVVDGERHTIAIDRVQNYADGTVGAKTVKSLLMTQDLNDFRVKLWNQAIDLLESMMIVMVVKGGNIEEPAFVEGVKCYVTALKRRLGL